MSSAVTQVKKTSLYDQHVAHGAKMIEFGSWLMPVSYESIIEEHRNVREKCGLFDVSHMGEIRVKGTRAAEFLQYITVNDVHALSVGKGQYTAMLNEQAGFVDDLIHYQIGDQEFFLVVNASNVDKDFNWIREHATQFNVSVINESERYSQIAVQGPNSLETLISIVSQDTAGRLRNLDYMEITTCKIFGRDTLIARTGYTGELGYEVYLDHDVAPKAWIGMMATSPKTGVKPIGLGARDTLRLEACYLLYGNDMNESVNPLEAGISWAVKMDSGNFIGRDALKAQKNASVKYKAIAFTLKEPGIARHDMKIYKHGSEIGLVTSGSFLPTINAAGGMARILSNAGNLGDEIEIDIRGKRKLANIVRKPLYSARVK